MKLIELEEGDTLVLRVPYKLEPGVAEQFQVALRTLAPNNKIVIMENGMDLDVLKPPKPISRIPRPRK